MWPMTIVCAPPPLKEAQAVRPSGGVSFTPAAVGAMSERGYETGYRAAVSAVNAVLVQLNPTKVAAGATGACASCSRAFQLAIAYAGSRGEPSPRPPFS